MKPFILGLLVLVSSPLQAQITFSEIMFDVATNEYHDEFIEIFNLSYSDSIAIDGWIFSDSSAADQIISISGQRYLSPRRFAVILDKSYFDHSTVYDDVLPDSVLILSISDNAFGNSGLSNTQGEYLTICDSAGEILSAYRYTTGNLPGYSDEKILLDGENDPANWQNSTREGGTPGWVNSVSPARIDYGFNSRSLILPDLIIEAEPLPMALKIFQFGIENSAAPLQIEVFADLNGDSLLQGSDRLIAGRQLPAAEQVFDFTWENPLAGRYPISAVLTQEEDERSENNRLIVDIEVFSETDDLKLNEIKFLGDEDEPEWIELVNTGTEPVCLTSWSLMDIRDTVTIDTALVIQPASYLVLCEDQMPEKYGLNDDQLLIMKDFPTLNDQGDLIQICSPLGKIVEKVLYENDWLEGEAWRRVSLEKINPLLNTAVRENWGPCLDPDGGTPGRRNSLYAEKQAAETDINVAPNPFSPDGDGNDDVTLISGQLALSSARIKAQIFDLKGRLIRTLEDNRFSGNDYMLVWDGRDESRRVARIGIYIVFLQILNDRQGILRELKTTVVLAKKLN